MSFNGSLSVRFAGPRAMLRVLGSLAMLGMSLTGALAQAIDCGQLQAAIATGTRGDPSAAARYSAAARKQQYELDRTASYAQQLGCNNRQFLFFGSPPPPQCAGIDQQVQRMRANLSQLQAQLQQASGEGQRQALLARYDTYCRQGRRSSGNFFDQLFGNEVQPQDLPPVTTEDLSPRGGSKAVCVRTCDGGFFPVSYSARRGGSDDLEELCHALCPNAETQLFTYSPSGDIEQAVSADGMPYKSLPNALKYRTKFDPTCTCKPANKSWVQALADAEQLLGRSSKNDIIVTEQKAAELSRPVQARVAPVAARTKGKPDPKAPAGKPDDDPTLAAEAAANASAPTASKESAGIAAGSAAGARTYGLRDGETREEVDSKGNRRKIRIIGPTL